MDLDNNSNKKKLFKRLYDKPIEIYLMWSIIAVSILVFIIILFNNSLCGYRLKDLEFVR